MNSSGSNMKTGDGLCCAAPAPWARNSHSLARQTVTLEPHRKNEHSGGTPGPTNRRPAPGTVITPHRGNALRGVMGPRLRTLDAAPHSRHARPGKQKQPDASGPGHAHTAITGRIIKLSAITSKGIMRRPRRRFGRRCPTRPAWLRDTRQTCLIRSPRGPRPTGAGSTSDCGSTAESAPTSRAP